MGIGRTGTEGMGNRNKTMPLVSVGSVTGELTNFKMQPFEPDCNTPLCRRHDCWGYLASLYL